VLYSLKSRELWGGEYSGGTTFCSLLLGEDEWKLLYCAANKTKKKPKRPYTIKEAVDYLGRPGGPKRASSDGPPGVKTIWIGLMKLYILPA
jgi:hypothetical protein